MGMIIIIIQAEKHSILDETFSHSAFCISQIDHINQTLYASLLFIDEKDGEVMQYAKTKS